MTRSRRKTPIMGNTTAKSEKWWKTEANRAMRRCPVDAEPPKKIEFSNIWDGPKDGKHYFKNAEDKWMRK